MSNLIKQPQKLISVFHLLRNQNQKLVSGVGPRVLFTNYSSQVKFYGCVQSRDLLASHVQHRTIISRQKSKAKKRNLQRREEEEDSDDENDEDDIYDEEYVEDDALVKTYNFNSMRVDLILKQVFSYKRKKIEEFFYGNKIRFNGKVLFKKAENANVGDILDIVKGHLKNDPELIEVARVEILKLSKDDTDDERVLVKIKKYKNLVIENYPDGDSWKESKPNLEP